MIISALVSVNTLVVFLYILVFEWTECMLLIQVVQADEAAANTAAQEAQAIKVQLESHYFTENRT